VDDDARTRDELTTTAAVLRRLLDAIAGAESVRQVVPHTLRVGAALGWRLLVVVAALYVLGIVVSYLAALVVPVAIALLLAALLAPAVSYLVTHTIPRGLATALVLVGGLAQQTPLGPPSPSGASGWLCAARRLHDAAPGVRRPWTPTNGRATTAGSEAG
jgi:hypothetical protein